MRFPVIRERCLLALTCIFLSVCLSTCQFVRIITAPSERFFLKFDIRDFYENLSKDSKFR
jgi:hypothetical protein